MRYHAHQREQGRRSWTTPDIPALPAFLDRLWREWLYSPGGGSAPVLLSGVQEQAVWEGILGGPSGEYPLLDVPGTARRASEAWKIAHDYGLPIRGGEFQASDDCQAFLGWAREYEQTCRDNRWLDRATLPAFLTKRIAGGEIKPPARIFYAGFDELTPHESALFNILNALPVEPVHRRPRQRDMWILPDARHEMEAAAAWARKALENGATARIGVVIPDLQEQRCAAQRIFQQALDPRPFAAPSAAFHISLGPPLSQYPVIHAGLTILEAAVSWRALPLPLAGSLLRSPFLDGAQEEAAWRAALDRRLRRNRRFEISLDFLRESASNCRILKQRLDSLAAEIAGLPARRPAGAWAGSFARILSAAGWPGGRNRDSVEYQAMESWRELLGAFASLSLALGPLSFSEAVARIRLLASETPFQPEDRGAPVQVIGVLEAGGLDFDHLWIMGLHDGAFPSSPHPNPFLPLELLRRFSVPHSTPAAELAAARRVLERLTASALHLTLSCPERRGEQELRPTPLLEQSWRKISNNRAAHRTAVMEEVVDDRASRLPEGHAQSGGAGVLKQMSACPFRAFAEYRLGTRELEATEMGISALERGSAVHKALETFWNEIQSHRALCELSGEELAARIAVHVDAALESLKDNFIYRLEQSRLRRLLREWLEAEKLRTPFTVVTREGKVDAELSGLKLQVRVDRVDELPDGRHLILDYKTGEIDKKAWLGERMKEPQLPFYCTIHETPLAGLAFAQIRAGSSRFVGITPGARLPNMDKAVIDDVPFADQIELWRKNLERLAERFREGYFEVDPQKKVCDYCPHSGLCRVDETGDGDEDDG